MRAVEQRVEALEQSVERGDKWVEGEFEVAEKGLGLLTEELEELKQSMAELKAELARLKAAPAKKAKKAAAEPAEALKPSKAPSAWNQLVAQTVAEMRESGWQSWTDLKGVVWPASKRALVKDKSGALSEAWVYDGGEHDGKPPSPALGGMVRASCLKAQSDPEVMAKALAYHAKLAEKRQSSSSSASVSGASAAEPPKKVRAKMTEEQKAAAAAKRAAKKAGAEAASATTSDAEQPKAAAEPKPKPKRVQSEGQKAWGALVADTVAQMKEHGWEAWTDAKSGAAWPASAASSAGHVFSEGPHQGKVPSNQRGGMSRASFLKAQAVGLQGEWAEMERE
jgi:hypothetical protein